MAHSMGLLHGRVPPRQLPPFDPAKRFSTGSNPGSWRWSNRLEQETPCGAERPRQRHAEMDRALKQQIGKMQRWGRGKASD